MEKDGDGTRREIRSRGAARKGRPRQLESRAKRRQVIYDIISIIAINNDIELIIVNEKRTLSEIWKLQAGSDIRIAHSRPRKSSFWLMDRRLHRIASAKVALLVPK